jgi:hypothetical protein
MRRWIHTCYSLVTNEGFSNFDSQITTLTRALALPCTWKVFLSWTNEQEYSKKRWRGCIYTPHSQIQPLPANSVKYTLTRRAGRHDRTRRSNVTVEKLKDIAEWPDAPIRGDRTCLVYKDLTVLWPDARSRPISDDRTRQVSKVPYWNMIGRVRSLPSHVRLDRLPSETRVNTINASGSRRNCVWSTRLKRSDC